MRPHYWQPGAAGEQVALKVHFDLKEAFGLPEAVMTDNTLILHDPVRPGDRISEAAIARRLGMDPFELRLRHLVKEGDVFVTGEKLVSVGITECLERTARAIGWNGKEEQSAPPPGRNGQPQYSKRRNRSPVS